MAYIRPRSAELTGYQTASPLRDRLDVGCDFVMVYGIDDTMPDRVRQYREAGYAVHLMTGIAWGDYIQYLRGDWDGRDHWDEAQQKRDGTQILHGVDVPYMVPTLSFIDYLTAFLKNAVDAGVEAVHVEEPEFWDHGGYSPAFQREYALYYRTPWVPPHESVDARFRAGQLKAYLYTRAIDRIGSALKDYALTVYGRLLRFYVPTHSLLNYTQWKIVSPEGLLLDVPSLDGYIAQVWTGTSRSKNTYAGVTKERTFETAFLEYGVMQELVRGTGRTMWFLHDPIEDNPSYGWADYRADYLRTVVASLLHPGVARYEICPWPDRVFYGQYPAGSPDAAPIPPDYATLLNNLFQMLGDMDHEAAPHAADVPAVGVFLSDSALFQRGLPDNVDPAEAAAAAGCASTFPHFYGLALPLLKTGVPVRPVLLENTTRYPAYLRGYDAVILSYEYQKPASAAVHLALAAYVRAGGTLVYCGDDADPYHAVSAWWNVYGTARAHLLSVFGLHPDTGDGVYPFGAGRFALYRKSPAALCGSAEAAARYLADLRTCIALPETAVLSVQRGPYQITAVLDEAGDGAPCVRRGLFADMLEPDFPVLREKSIPSGGCAVLYDLADCKPDTVVGTSVRIVGWSACADGAALRVRGASALHAAVRLCTSRPVRAAHIERQGGVYPAAVIWDEASGTVLIRYDSTAGDAVLRLYYE